MRDIGRFRPSSTPKPVKVVRARHTSRPDARDMLATGYSRDLSGRGGWATEGSDMVRRAFALRLGPGPLAGCQRRHDEACPGLVAGMERSGTRLRRSRSTGAAGDG